MSPMESARRPAGRVSLVGAGPGDPDLITVKGRQRLRSADVVVHDRLVDPRLIEIAPPGARRIDVGKSPGRQPWPQSRINALLIAEARRHRNVVRLKGGDPFVFGRGGEECEALVRAGIGFEVVPGVTSATAAPAYAGIPVTHRDHGHAFAVVTGHLADEADTSIDWGAIARIDTVVVLMGLARLGTIVTALRGAGRSGETPVAVVGRAASESQTVVRGCLADIETRVRGLRPPATIVVGEVAALSGRLSWFKPATGIADDYPVNVA
jgi:uroporphyrin-III C-methyltransferase